MHARHYLPLISVIALTLLPSFGYGQAYSWKDASGKIHYGDRPPAEKKAEVRKLAPAPMTTDDVEAARKAGADRKMDEREKQSKAQEDAKKSEDPAQAKQREDNCRQARANLTAIESGEVRFSINDKGERVGLDGSVREAELAKARKSVDDWCKAPVAK
jgi:Domain of unknown function (DUF4124)